MLNSERDGATGGVALKVAVSGSMTAFSCASRSNSVKPCVVRDAASGWPADAILRSVPTAMRLPMVVAGIFSPTALILPRSPCLAEEHDLGRVGRS